MYCSRLLDVFDRIQWIIKIKEIEKKNLLLRIYNIEKKEHGLLRFFFLLLKIQNYCIDAHTLVSYNYLPLWWVEFKFDLTFGWGTKDYVQNWLEPFSGILHHYHLTRESTLTNQDYNPSSVVYVPEPIRAIYWYLPSIEMQSVVMTLSEWDGWKLSFLINCY